MYDDSEQSHLIEQRYLISHRTRQIPGIIYSYTNHGTKHVHFDPIPTPI